ncbi:MAG: hypothetical protein F6K40_13225 [Okeania sp. SIO3I5]|nr:hypothetical protein [Okeania sp. SIO3I5]
MEITPHLTISPSPPNPISLYILAGSSKLIASLSQEFSVGIRQYRKKIGNFPLTPSPDIFLLVAQS